MNDTGVLSNWRKWRTEADNSLCGNRSYHNNENPHNHLTASNSRSDTNNSKRTPNHPTERYHAVGLETNTKNQDQNPHRRAACHFRVPNANRRSSFTEGFPQLSQDDDEPADILVWNTTKGYNPATTRHQYQRSLSDTNDKFSMPDTQKPCLVLKTSVSKSLSTKSLDRAIKRVPSEDSNLEYENQLAAVTEQLEMIKTTQDSILSELSSDISTLQFENIHLKNTNEHLTMQNSHLLHVVNDMSNEVELMRQVFRSRGWPIHQDDDPRSIIDILQASNNKINTKDKPKQKSLRHHQMEQQSFEDIPLNYTDSSGSACVSSRNRNNNRNSLSGPVDDQVLSLSNRSHHRDFHKKKKHHSKSKSAKVKESTDERKTTGCFRGLFKRKKGSNHRIIDEDNGE